jgi:hypothetical protein
MDARVKPAHDDQLARIAQQTPFISAHSAAEDARERAYAGIQGPQTLALGPRFRGDERIESLLRRASDGAARLERTHFVSAPDEAAAEPAADP